MIHTYAPWLDDTPDSTHRIKESHSYYWHVQRQLMLSSDKQCKKLKWITSNRSNAMQTPSISLVLPSDSQSLTIYSSHYWSLFSPMILLNPRTALQCPSCSWKNIWKVILRLATPMLVLDTIASLALLLTPLYSFIGNLPPFLQFCKWLSNFKIKQN